MENVLFFSFTKTPEWISTINSQLNASQGSLGTQGDPLLQTASPRLPSPPEIAALLSTHLHNIQQQQFMPRPPPSANQSDHSLSQPNSFFSNPRQLDISEQSASLPPNINDIQYLHSVSGISQSMAPPQNVKSTNQRQGQYTSAHPSNCSVHSDSNQTTGQVEGGSVWEGAVGMQSAVPIRPPHQCDDPYLNDDNNSVLSGEILVKTCLVGLVIVFFSFFTKVERVL